MKQILTILCIAFAITISKGKIINVAAKDSTFEPANISIKVGDTVHWTVTASQHTITSGTSCKGDGIFNTGQKFVGDTFNYIFTKTGAFPYFCKNHCDMGMVGMVTVEALSGITREINPLISFKSYPNPFNESTSLSYDLDKNAKVNINVTNALGQRILVIETIESAGLHSRMLDMSSVNKGLYILHISIDGMPAKEITLLKE